MKSKTITLKIKKWLLLCFVFMTALFGMANAQAVITTPNPPFTPNQSLSGRNFITFVIENTNNIPYNLNQISTYVIATDNNAVYRLYCSTTNLSGPGNVYNDFTLIATSGTNTVVAPGYDVLPFAGLNFQIP